MVGLTACGFSSIGMAVHWRSSSMKIRMKPDMVRSLVATLQNSNFVTEAAEN
jgi:hypothetical protein